MPRDHYTQSLRNLQDELLVMGSMVSHALADSVKALKKRDRDTALRLIDEDRAINSRRYDLEDRCLTLIATQQPMAHDLRFLAGVLEISTELERIGDYAKGIGRIILYLGPEPLLIPMVHIPQMCDKVISMLGRSLDAFIHEDVESARAIPQEDDEVDRLYNLVNRELLQVILVNPTRLDHVNNLSWAAHNLERAGDRVTNICERVIYMATGTLVEFDVTEPMADFG
ncbi:MAG: phosphate signaling complex protein PhoU [Caldilineaceae bacterium]|nr:phosphate signaling complex protein PhoU [Caldilineaceae bacterium]